MKREKIFYITAIVLLVVVLIGCLYYKRPLDIKELTGVTNPDNISISVSAGDEGFDELLARLEEIKFRRPPTNLVRIALPFLPELGESSKEWEDGDFQHLVISLSQPGEGETRIQGHVRFWIDEWEYRDFDRAIMLPLAVENSKATGQDLCAELWDMATPVETSP